MIETLSHQTPLGEIVLAAQEDALIGLWFRGQKYEFSTLKGEQAENPDSALLREAVRWVDAYFEGSPPRSPVRFRCAPSKRRFARRSGSSF